MLAWRASTQLSHLNITQNCRCNDHKHPFLMILLLHGPGQRKDNNFSNAVSTAMRQKEHLNLFWRVYKTHQVDIESATIQDGHHRREWLFIYMTTRIRCWIIKKKKWWLIWHNNFRLVDSHRLAAAAAARPGIHTACRYTLRGNIQQSCSCCSWNYIQIWRATRVKM